MIEKFTKPAKEMRHLKKISLSFNKIREFYFGSHFSQIYELRLNNNKLINISKDIIYMTNLKLLCIQNNFIINQDFLNYLSQLNYLKNIVLSDNPFFKKMNVHLLNELIKKLKYLKNINFVPIPPNRKFVNFPFDSSKKNNFLNDENLNHMDCKPKFEQETKHYKKKILPVNKNSHNIFKKKERN